MSKTITHCYNRGGKPPRYGHEGDGVVDYRNIMVAVDNLDYSTHRVDIGIEIAKDSRS